MSQDPAGPGCLCPGLPPGEPSADLLHICPAARGNRPLTRSTRPRYTQPRRLRGQGAQAPATNDFSVTPPPNCGHNCLWTTTEVTFHRQAPGLWTLNSFARESAWSHFRNTEIKVKHRTSHFLNHDSPYDMLDQIHTRTHIIQQVPSPQPSLISSIRFPFSFSFLTQKSPESSHDSQSHCNQQLETQGLGTHRSYFNYHLVPNERKKACSDKMSNVH